MKNNLPDGIGLFIYPDLKYHSGYYQNGLLQGLSRINFGNGDLGKMHGHGFFVNAGNNEWVFGRFEEDECIEVIEGGSGVPSDDIGKERSSSNSQKNIDL